MKKYALILLLGFIACKSNKTTKSEGSLATAPIVTTSSATDTATPAADTSGKVRLVVSFYSIGSGVEFTLVNAYEDSIGSYAGRLGKTIDYKKAHWGREGETEFCLKLKELNSSQQADFVLYTKEVLKKAKWVHINEYERCRH